MKKKILMNMKKIALLYLWILFVPLAFIMKIIRFFATIIKDLFLFIKKKLSGS